MNIEKIKRSLHQKVDSLEQTKKIQQNYIKYQFNTGRNKGYKDQQKIKAWLSYSKLSIISFLIVGITPIIAINYLPVVQAAAIQIFFVALGIWALINIKKHNSH